MIRIRIRRWVAAASAFVAVVGSVGLVVTPANSVVPDRALSVSVPTVTLSSSSAAATDVTYTIGFTAAAGVAAGGTITLRAHSGTLFPPAAGDYVLTDATTPSGSDTQAGGVKFANPGLPIYNFENPSGSLATIIVGNAILPGDAISLAVTGVSNPGPSVGVLSVSTSGDPIFVPSAPVTITAATSVTSPTLSLSGLSAGASHVGYKIGFTTTSDIPAGGTITLAGPPGMLWPSTQDLSAYVLTDSTHGTGSFSSALHETTADPGLQIYNFLNYSGAVVTITVPNEIPAGDVLSLAVADVANPGAGHDTVSVSTSADAVPVALPSYTLVSPSSVSTPTVSAVPATSGSPALYTIGLTTTSAMPAGGVLTLQAPVGTVWPASSSAYVVTDATTPADSDSAAQSVAFAGTNSVVALTLANPLAAGDAITVAVTGVTNPGAGSPKLVVRTSADPSPATSASYAITGTAAAPTSVTAASVTPTSTTGSANGVTYSVAFTTSATGSIPASTGTITLAAPGGTVFGNCYTGCGGGNPTYTIFDSAHPAGVPASPNPPIANNSIVDVIPSVTIPASTPVTLTITQVTNPPAGAGSMTILTSADPAGVTVDDTATTPQPVSDTSFSTTSTAGNASGVTDTFSFTVSGTGELENGLGAITLSAPPGSVFGNCFLGCSPTNPTFTIVDHTNPSGDSAAGPDVLAADNSTVSVIPNNTIHAGDQLTMSVTQITNPPAGSGDIELSTSSDPVRVSLTAPTTSPDGVHSAALTVSSHVAAATGVTYLASFRTSPTGDLENEANVALGSVTVEGPPGTDFSPVTSAQVNDLTNPAAGGVATVFGFANGHATVNVELPHTIAAGDVIAIALHGVTNGLAGNRHVLLATSSDIARVVLPFHLGAGHALTGIVHGSDLSPAMGVSVQACATTGGCTITSTDSGGHYKVEVTNGNYAVTAFAGAGSNDGSKSKAVTVAHHAVHHVHLRLPPPPSIAPGITLTSPSFGAEDSSSPAPRLFWNEPTTLTVDRSAFPAGGKVIFTQVVINGTDTTTGLPATKTVDVGGTVGGAPVGAVVGAGPVSVTIPALKPIHGDVTTSLNYQYYADPAAAPTGIAATQVLDEIYPPAPPSEQPTDPLPAYFTNDGNPSKISVGGGSIAGADKANFAIKPLSAVGVPATSTDCSVNPALLQEFDGSVSNPPPSTECGIAVQFTPPALASKIYYRATLTVKAGSNGGKLYVSLLGCDARAAAEAGFESCFQGTGGEVKGGDSSGGGGGGGDEGDGGGSSDGGGDYIDPSGVVYGTAGGSPVPLAGATVTLSRSEDKAGPFVVVPNGSAVMSAANRSNPSTTSSTGTYGWDVLAGAYQLQAAASGCTPLTSKPLLVPPPKTGIALTMTCTSLPSRASTHSTLSVSSHTPKYGAPLKLTATVSGGVAPGGSLTFFDSADSLGSSVVAGSKATLSLATLTPGKHHLTARYLGDATHQPSTSSPVVVTVKPPPVPTRLHGPTVVTHRHTAHLTGHAALGTTVTLHAAKPSGKFRVVGHVHASKTTGAFRFHKRITHGVRFYATSNSTRSYVVEVGTNPTLHGPGHVKRGKKATLAGVAPVGSKVALERRIGAGHYRKIGTTRASKKTGHYHFRTKVTGKATYIAVADKLRSKPHLVRLS